MLTFLRLSAIFVCLGVAWSQPAAAPAFDVASVKVAEPPQGRGLAALREDISTSSGTFVHSFYRRPVPSLSPDGTEVVFSWAGEREENIDLYVQLSPLGGDERKIAETTYHTEALGWTPDGVFRAVPVLHGMKKTGFNSHSGCAIRPIFAVST